MTYVAHVVQDQACKHDASIVIGRVEPGNLARL